MHNQTQVQDANLGPNSSLSTEHAVPPASSFKNSNGIYFKRTHNIFSVQKNNFLQQNKMIAPKVPIFIVYAA